MDFKSIIKDKTRLKKIMECAFSAIDQNGTGMLQFVELKVVLQHVADDIGVDRPTLQEIKDIMSQVDQNGDQKLSKQQFNILIQQVLQLMADCDQL